MDSKNVVVRRYPHFQKSGIQQRHNKISHPWLRYTEEVVQSSTTDIISLSCVLNVAFVFTYERALAEAMTFQGCTNFFILRCNTDGNPPNGFFPSFASEYESYKRVSCISSKIWKDSLRSSGSVRRMLSRETLKLGHHTCQHDKTAVGPEFWGHIKKEVSKRVWNSLFPFCWLAICITFLSSFGPFSANGLVYRMTSTRKIKEKNEVRQNEGWTFEGFFH